ncbi:radical SAM protein [Actinomadura macrotermitis]|uniref:Coenzyme PQQ synthesis protein E n=1 Tax=Actinomadura macrotermitis TaxID=2585200 RepID=A0A7K0BY79_9ACTN|nr:radical SAM protein [Actinomadura macrotermitis]MQY06129.1 Coenzyme PQQ synthesis protein E [Actinomadura macrotermitis]
MTIALESPASARQVPRLVWLDLTRKCQLNCGHCYNDSGAHGSHGEMARNDWLRVIDQISDLGVPEVQFIGGEPTLHPHAAELVAYALAAGLRAEVFSNLAHPLGDAWWNLLRHGSVRLATSYYSDDPDERNAITGRPSHVRTRANIVKAIDLGVRLRVGIVRLFEAQRVQEARRELEEIGVTGITIDSGRPFGRAAAGQAPSEANLCGKCGDGKAAIRPDGAVTPWVFADWLTVGSVRSMDLATLLNSEAMTRANAAIQNAPRSGACDPDAECSPGSPGSGCNPRN